MDCNACESHVNGPPIESWGDENAEIMIVGSLPTKQDLFDGKPFSGDAGAKFRYQLECAGLYIEDLYLTYAVKCMPPHGKKPSKGKHIDVCGNHLAREIVKVKPKVIVAMGDTAINSLIDQTNVKDSRGFFYNYDVEVVSKKKKTKSHTCLVIPTHNPSGCLTRWENDALVIKDLKRAKDYSQKNKRPKMHKVDVKVITSIEELYAMQDKLLAAKEFGFDFETTDLRFYKGEILCAIFSLDEHSAYVVPNYVYPKEIYEKYPRASDRNYTRKINKFVKANKKEITKVLRRVFKSKVKKIAHNGIFDAKYAIGTGLGFDLDSFSFDTCIAHSLLDENKPHTLTFILEWYGFIDRNYESDLWPYVGKDKSKPYDRIPPRILYSYGGYDGAGTVFLKRKFQKKLKKQGFMKLFKKQQMKLVREQIRQEVSGLPLDIKLLNKTANYMQGRLNSISSNLIKITGNENFNPNSTPQIASFLSDCNAPVIKQTKTGRYSTDDFVLTTFADDKKLSKKKVGKFAKLLLEYRHLSKQKSTYLDGKDGASGLKYYISDTNRLHYSSNIHTPRTGRMSIDKPALHQIPRKDPDYPDISLRNMFIPSRKKNVITSVDFKQLEMRIAAYLSNDKTMIKEIQDRVDIHSRNIVTFGRVLGLLPEDMTEKKFKSVLEYKPPKDWTDLDNKKEKKKIKKKLKKKAKYKELRVLAKTIGFGLNYGKTPYSIAKEFNRDVEEIEEMIDMYFEKYSDLAAWREEQKENWIDTGYSQLPFTGRKRRFSCYKWFNSSLSEDCFKRHSDIAAVDRQAMNFPVQGLANEVFVSGGDYKHGILKFAEELRRNNLKTKMKVLIHDGLLLDGPKAETKKVYDIAKKTLEIELNAGKPNAVPLSIDFATYDRWEGNKIWEAV